MKTISLPLILSVNGGYVDTAGFLALQGLFPAHVTGNFVTLSANLATGTTGAIPKLIALPMFCLMVFLARLAGLALTRRRKPVVKPLLSVQLVLLSAAAWLALASGPFLEGNAPVAVVMGMLLVSAMAIQNAIHRAHLGKAPPSTLMTGTTTQIMLDLAELTMRGSAENSAAAYARVRTMIVAVAAFAIGCAAAAFLYINVSIWCFLLPPVLIVAALASRTPALEA